MTVNDLKAKIKVELESKTENVILTVVVVYDSRGVQTLRTQDTSDPRHFGPRTLRTQDTSAPDTSALVPKCMIVGVTPSRTCGIS